MTPRRPVPPLEYSGWGTPRASASGAAVALVAGLLHMSWFGGRRGVGKGPRKDDVSSLLSIEQQLVTPFTNMLSENYFGNGERYMTKLGTSSVSLVSDHMIIRSSGKLVYGTKIMASSQNNKHLKTK